MKQIRRPVGQRRIVSVSSITSAPKKTSRGCDSVANTSKVTANGNLFHFVQKRPTGVIRFLCLEERKGRPIWRRSILAPATAAGRYRSKDMARFKPRISSSRTKENGRTNLPRRPVNNPFKIFFRLFFFSFRERERKDRGGSEFRRDMIDGFSAQ